jgi:hypothetical protein
MPDIYENNFAAISGAARAIASAELERTRAEDRLTSLRVRLSTSEAAIASAQEPSRHQAVALRAEGDAAMRAGDERTARAKLVQSKRVATDAAAAIASDQELVASLKRLVTAAEGEVADTRAEFERATTRHASIVDGEQQKYSASLPIDGEERVRVIKAGANAAARFAGNPLPWPELERATRASAGR